MAGAGATVSTGAAGGGGVAAAPARRRPWQPSPQGVEWSRVPSSRSTAAWGMSPWLSSRASVPLTWGAANDVPATDQ